MISEVNNDENEYDIYKKIDEKEHAANKRKKRLLNNNKKSSKLETMYMDGNAGFLLEIADDPEYWIEDTGANTHITMLDEGMVKLKKS